MPATTPRPHRGARPPRRRRLTAALALVAVHVAALAWILAPVTGTSAQPAPGEPVVDVEVDRSSGLTDGTVIDVTVRARPGVTLSTNPTVIQDVRICRPGVAYATAADLRHTSGNCPVFFPVSTSSLASKTLYPLPDGSAARTSIAVGTGTAEWIIGGQTHRLTCDADNPCLLVAQVRASVGGAAPTDVFAAVELSFDEAGPLAGCRPAADGFTSAGSDRMQAWWTALSVASCSGGSVPSNFGPLGEGGAVANFAAGSRDVAYTATGYRPEAPELAPSSPRAAVYTPVALNAAVVVAIGGDVSYADPTWPIGMPHPYSDVRLTAAEVATMFGRGLLDFEITHADQVRARNPELAGDLYWKGDTSKVGGPIAVQEVSAVTLFATGYLDARAPEAWRSRDLSGQADAIDRGVLAAFAGAEPAFYSITPISTKSQLAALQNVTIQQSPSYAGPGWALTDYATAVELGLTPAAIENAAGEFVAPTPASLAAAVPTMTVDADGRRTPDVATTAAGAYPLTMIEYAMAPAEPLADDACAPRTGAQALLGAWLQYVTGSGQQEMPAGLVPLTPDLQAEAVASIARVGATPSAACPTTPTTQPPPVTPVVAAPGGSGLPSGGSTSPFAPTRRSPERDAESATADAVAPSSPDELEGAAALAEAATPTLPPFLGVRAVSEVISPVALLLIVVLTAGTAFTTSGRPLPAAVGRLPGRGAAGVCRVVRLLPRPWRPGR